MTKQIQKTKLARRRNLWRLQNQNREEKLLHESPDTFSLISDPTQATELAKASFQSAQRESIAVQIGHLQGNQHLQRIVQRQSGKAGEFKFTKLVRGPTAKFLEVEGTAPGVAAGRVDLYRYEGDGCNLANKLGDTPFNLPIIVANEKFEGKVSVMSSGTPGVGKKVIADIKNAKGETVGSCCGVVVPE